MKGVRKVGNRWQVRITRERVVRSRTCATEQEAITQAELWRTMPIQQYLNLLPNGKTDPNQL